MRSGAIVGEIALSVTFPPVASLEILASSGPIETMSLIVHEMALLEVTARSADGYEFRVPDRVSWDTSDGAVATVSDDGVVSAQRRGSATIGVSAGDVRAEMAVSGKARVKITPSYRYYRCGWCLPENTLPPGSGWPLEVGDTLLLSATYFDIDGVPLDDDASARWTSDNPDAVSVTEGRVVALLPSSRARIVAWVTDGTDVAEVRVSDVVAAGPAPPRVSRTRRQA